MLRQCGIFSGRFWLAPSAAPSAGVYTAAWVRPTRATVATVFTPLPHGACDDQGLHGTAWLVGEQPTAGQTLDIMELAH